MKLRPARGVPFRVAIVVEEPIEDLRTKCQAHSIAEDQKDYDE